MPPRSPPGYYVPSPCSRDEPTRKFRIEEDVPQAKAALDRIESSTVDLKFGESVDDFLNNYHFPSDTEIEDYFRVYLEERGEEEINPAKIKRYLRNTINRRPHDDAGGQFATHRAFKSIAAELQDQIEAASEENYPMVKLIIGPTGAGKTAFSKSLFTVCLLELWAARIIPSRVEFSKYWQGLDPRDGMSEADRDDVFFSFVRRCQLRDLLVYFCLSGAHDHEAKLGILTSLRVPIDAEIAVLALVEGTRGLAMDGPERSLPAKVRGLFTKTLDEIGEAGDKLLFSLSGRLGVRFLVSFDGFDSTRLEHFLFERRENPPIHYLVRTLKGIHQKKVFRGAHSSRLETHYLAYLRDTTFARLRTELFTSPKGPLEFPVLWIVPPSYRLLVRNAAVYLTRSHDLSVNKADVFADDVASAFDGAVFDRMELNAATHLAFVFGSSGRRMKAHIRQLMYSALDRAHATGTFDFVREGSGVDPKTMWLELVEHHSAANLPFYLILEELFLDASRQLVPKLELGPTTVTRKLEEGDFFGLIEHIVDPDDANVIFGCVFNYFYQCVVEDEVDRQPGVLVLVRILQYVDRHPHCVAGDVKMFLRAIGYEISDAACDFALFVVLRAELLKWNASKGLRLIRDVPLYITTTGRIAIEKLIFSVTYVSEAILSSILIDRAMEKSFRHRASDINFWIADCIHNASLALHVVTSIEQVESRIAARNGVDIEPFLVHPRMGKTLSREARMIIGKASRKTHKRSEENFERLKALRATHPGLRILGGR